MKTIFAILLALVLTGPVYAADDVWYLRVDTDDASWTALKTTLETKHDEMFPNNVMSITPNLAVTEAIVKIVGATAAWRSANSIDVTHDAIFEMSQDNSFALNLFYNDVNWKWPEPD